MVIDIASLDLKERPVLALENLDETPIAILGNAFNIEAHIAYNEVSSITFDLPAYVNGTKTPGYDDVIGTRLIRFAGWGVFILVNPETTGDGIREIKSCKAYSREYELTYKKMSLEENTYNLWNPVAPDSTILGIILSYLPYWSVGSVDSDLIGKYRTFSENNVNIYNFLKNTVQTKYGCIVDFNTVTRTINLKSTASITATKPVYLSLNNLAKEIEREEDTENIFTCLDVNGADGVDIRSVNPTGTNKIYNLDYYMNTSHFSQEFINKWNTWKTAFDEAQDTYYLLTIERMLKTSEIVFTQSEIDDTGNADLKALEAEQSVLIEALAQSNPTSSDYSRYAAQLQQKNNQIAIKEAELAAKRTDVVSLEAEKAVLTTALQAINRRLAFETIPSEDSPTDDPDDPSFIPLFTASEVLLLKQYFKEDSISDSSFVYAEAKNYDRQDITSSLNSSSAFSVTGSVSETTTSSAGRTILKFSGGSVSIGNLTAALIKATAEYDPNTHHTVFTAYLSVGTVNGSSFPDGCLTAVTDGGDLQAGASSGGSFVSFTGGAGRMYFTRNTTEYEKYAVEWDLYEYGRQCLEKLAYPSYSFSLDTANFLSLDAFQAFKNQLTLGQKVYIDMDDGNVLTPIFVGFEIDFEDASSLKLEFGDKYCLKDSAFELADLLNQSVSMGKTVDVSRFGYNAFIDSGASTAVKDYMDAALDVSKQAVLSSTGVDITWDASGMTFRKKNDNGYLPTQIKIINDNIVFTDDAWASAKMAIGHFKDKTDLEKDISDPTHAPHESWGVVAPNIVGTLLAGENLVIESKKQSNETAVFKVDADGAVLHNSKFDIVRSNTVAPGATQTSTHILLDPDLGFGIGTYPLVSSGVWDETKAKFWVDMQGNVRLNNGYIDIRRSNTSGSGETQIKIDPSLGFGIGTYPIDSNNSWDTTNAKFYVDTAGNLHIKGNLDAATGTFSGELSAATGYFNGIVRASDYQVLKNGNYVSMMNNNNQFNPDYLNLKGLTITNNNDVTTFSVDSNGNVSVNGNITMGSESSILWTQVNGRPNMNDYTENSDFSDSNTDAGAVAQNASNANTKAAGALSIADLIANGHYTGTTIDGVTYTATFINGKTIYSPIIVANELIAKPPSGTSDTSGKFILNDSDGDKMFEMFYTNTYDNAPCVDFSASSTAWLRFLNFSWFYNGIQVHSGSAEFNGPIVLQSGETYGSSTQRDSLSSTAISGQIFFVTS